MMGPMAFGIGANVRVGNLLGGGHPRAARVAAVLSITIGAAWTAGCALLIVIFRRVAHSASTLIHNLYISIPKSEP